MMILKNKKSNKLMFIVMISILLIIAMISIYTNRTAFANDNSFSFYQGKYNDFTDSDNFDTGNILSYPVLYQNSSEVVKNGANYSLNVTKDDEIIKIIPKELFANNGEYLYIGKEYGFFVLTETSVYSYLDNNNSWVTMPSLYNKHSYVLVFDIINQFDLLSNNGVISTMIKPLYQYQYLYLSKNLTTASLADNNGYNNVDYCYQLNYSITKDYVVPAPRINLLGNINYGEENRFYLKDISFGMNLFNEQEYNQGNGEKYNPYNDIGSYFTYADYEYNGVTRKNGTFPEDEALLIAEYAVDIGLGVAKLIPGLNPAIGMIEDGINLIRTGSDILNIYLGFNNFLTKQNVEVSSGKITAKNYHANRDDQINNYGKIVKSAGFAINTDNNESVWYGKNNSCTGHFQIGHSALNGQVPNYTRLARSLAMKVVDINGYETAESSNENFMLRNPNNKVLKLDKNEDIILLPDGINTFGFQAEYTSDYIISIEGISNYTLKINGTPLTATNNIFKTRITKNSNNNLEIKKMGTGAIGTINVKPNNTSSFNVNKSDQYLISTSFNGFKKIQTGNDNLKLKSVFAVENGNLVNIDSIIKEKNKEFDMYFDNTNYYFVIENVTISSQTANISVTNIATINLNTDKSINVNSNGSIIEFNSTMLQSYILSLNSDNIILTFFNNCGEYSTSVDRFSDKNNIAKFTLNSNEKIYIKIATNTISTNLSVVMQIKTAATSFQWYINDQLCTTKQVEVPRGTTKTFYCMINNTIKVNPFMFINIDTYDGVTIKDNNTIIVATTSKIGGVGFDIIALGNNDGSNLKVIPIFEGYIDINTSENSENNLEFSWRQPYYVKSIEVIAKLDSTTKEYTLIGSGYNNYNYKSIFSDFAYIKSLGKIEIYVSKIKFIDVHNSEVLQTINKDPIHIHSAFEKGNGTSGEPYIISNIRHFNNIIRGGENRNLFYKQTCTLDFKGTRPATSLTNFFGDLNGNIQIIKGIKIDSQESEAGGLFKFNYGVIHNYFAITVNINSSNDSGDVGGIVAGNFGTLLENMVTGVIDTRSSNYRTGGLAAYNVGLIKSCVNQATIYSIGDVGGIVSNSFTEVSNCMNFGKIYIYFTTNNSAGGVVGYNTGIVKTCSSSGGATITFTPGESRSRTLAPIIGQVVGWSDGGTTSNLSASNTINKGYLHTETWKEGGFLGIGATTKTHNQAMYVGGLVGKTS